MLSSIDRHQNTTAELSDVKAMYDINQTKKSILEHETKLLTQTNAIHEKVFHPSDNVLADIMQADESVLKQLGVCADYKFTPYTMHSGNTSMQICAWDPSLPGSCVSGFIDVRAAFNVNTHLQGNDIVMPMSVYAASRNRAEVLRDAMREQPTLSRAYETLCDVFENSNSVVFKTLPSKPDRVVSLDHATDKRHVMISTCAYTANRSARLGKPCDLEVERVVVSYHPDIKTQRIVSEAVTVKDNTTKTVACFVMTNAKNSSSVCDSNPQHQATAASPPGTVAHMFGMQEDLVAYSKDNILQQNNLTTSAYNVLQGAACMKAFANQAVRSNEESFVYKAFESCRIDPVLKTACMETIEAHPGLRVMRLTLYKSNPAVQSKDICLVLSAIKDCRDSLSVTAGAGRRTTADGGTQKCLSKVIASPTVHAVPASSHVSPGAIRSVPARNVVPLPSTPVPEPRVVERAVERAVERPVERAVERPVERVVERPVERAVERPVERAVERVPEPPKPQHRPERRSVPDKIEQRTVQKVPTRNITADCTSSRLSVPVTLQAAAVEGEENKNSNIVWHLRNYMSDVQRRLMNHTT